MKERNSRKAPSCTEKSWLICLPLLLDGQQMHAWNHRRSNGPGSQWYHHWGRGGHRPAICTQDNWLPAILLSPVVELLQFLLHRSWRRVCAAYRRDARAVQLHLVNICSNCWCQCLYKCWRAPTWRECPTPLRTAEWHLQVALPGMCPPQQAAGTWGTSEEQCAHPPQNRAHLPVNVWFQGSNYASW